MSRPAHDSLVQRLARILGRLNDGDALDPAELAADFGVNPRTIQRDLNDRFGYLDLVRTGGRYRLDPARLGRLSTPDLDRFAALAGVRGLFPSLTNEFLRELFDGRVQSAYSVRGHDYEDLNSRGPMFRQVERAIVERRLISFDLVKAEGRKGYVDIEPHKLVNHKGIWYLAAKDAGKLKTFAFSRMQRLLVLDQTFEHDPTVDNALAENDGIWFGDQRQQVVISVAAEVADYFKRRKLIANQVIQQELPDGGLIVLTTVGHPNQVLPIVRYWIPHLRIISPANLQSELEAGLSAYLPR
jgi:predicted DNA-binding transcriptional regulator YafY